jgi:tetratricopeptide (TPR) repeat protein
MKPRHIIAGAFLLIAILGFVAYIFTKFQVEIFGLDSDIYLKIIAFTGAAAFLSAFKSVIELFEKFAKWFGKTPKSKDKIHESLLVPTSPDQIRAVMTDRGKITYIPREVTNTILLGQYGKIVITGVQKQGKTREAAELIDQVIKEGKVEADRVFELGPKFALEQTENIASAIRESVNPQSEVLLFIDDLPRMFDEDGLKKLSECLKALKKCKDVFVIATARLEQLQEFHEEWLRTQGFYPAKLPNMSSDNIGRHIDLASGVFGIPVTDAARTCFMGNPDGRPELVVISLKLAVEAGIKQLNEENADGFIQEGVIRLWSDVRRKLVEQDPGAKHLLQAIATFHSSKITSNIPLVINYSDYLWKQQDELGFSLLRKRRLDKTLGYWSKSYVSCKDGNIVPPDILVEGLVDLEQGLENLKSYFIHHRRIYRHPLLRKLNRFSNFEATAIAQLSSVINDQQEKIKLISIAISIDPQYEYLILRSHHYSNHGDLQLAIDDYSKLIQMDPQDKIAHMNRGIVFGEQGNLQLAFYDFNKAIELDPHFAEAYINRGVAYNKQGNQQLAIDDYNKAIELDPHIAVAYNNRGNAYNNQGDTQHAIDDFSKAIELDPTLEIAHNNRGLAYVSQGNFQLAIDDYNKAIELDQHSAKFYHDRGLAYYQEGDLQLAIDDHSKAIELDPMFAEAYYNRGLAYYNQGYGQLAIDNFSKAIELDPKFASAYYSRGGAYNEQGDTQMAINDFSKAIELDPKLSGAYALRGLAYYNQGYFQLAIVDYSKAIELDPQFAQTYYNRGLAHDDQGDPELAIIDYSKAIELDPQFAMAYNNRGIIYFDMGDWNLAIDDYYKAIKLNPQHPWTYNNRGNAHDKKGDTQLAIDDFSKAIELDPKFAIAYYNRGNSYGKQGNLQYAIDDYSKVIELNRQHLIAYVNRADSFILLKRLEEAEADCQAASALNSNHPSTLFCWGKLAYAKGEFQESVNYIKRANSQHSDPTEFNFFLGLSLLRLHLPEEAMDTITTRLDGGSTDIEIRDYLNKYKDLQSQCPELGGVYEAIKILQGALDKTT